MLYTIFYPALWFLWFPTRLFLYFTAFCDILCLVFGFAFSHAYYQKVCKCPHGIFTGCIRRVATVQIRKEIKSKVRDDVVGSMRSTHNDSHYN